ncbi:MAG: hypothetical protein ACP5I4_03095 [Oceanipulchritudo sp.]
MEGEETDQYEISGVEQMPPFLMTLASDSDHWLFILSNGALTAGRVNPDHALFPYYTQDKLLDMTGRSGSRSVVRIGGRIWEPFGPGAPGKAVTRRLRKNAIGNRIELEEEHREHGLVFRLSWRPGARFGFVRRVELENNGEGERDLELLDGLVNLLPDGLPQRFQNEFSILGDAYKQSELIEPEGLGLYHLSSVPTDLAEPMEALRATVAWQCGQPAGSILLSQDRIDDFLEGKELPAETSLRGRRGSYLLHRKIRLEPGEKTAWYICADVGKDLQQVEELREELRKPDSLQERIEADCEATERRLQGMLAAADGLQCTGTKSRCMRHTSNTLFNLMRGGALPTGYQLPTADVLATVEHFNRQAALRLRQVLGPTTELHCKDPWDATHPVSLCGKDAVRLLREYLPLSFSRRHGDPSRPWNRFSIEIKEKDGSPRFYYQGNWRDIFQNWEALLQAYPEYCEAAVCRFLNSSSADGYNPYRVTKDGFEWEVPEPGDPWANIGYWGDHQIIYLLRLLENSVRFHPGRLAGLLDEDTFVYVQIPYRIRPFAEILKNPRDTVDYDREWEERITARVQRIGNDGKLMPDQDGGILHVSLLEKLLTPLLAKLSNYIPGGGIWMNTQRPEWNDANNALVGFGVSVVTLGYVARYIRFLLKEFKPVLREGTFPLSSELADLLRTQLEVFREVPASLDEAERLDRMERLGRPASAYRGILYANGLSGEKDAIKGNQIREFLESALRHVEFSLKENKRPDGLWHSYNLLEIQSGGVGIKRLFIMLEGQVSVLSSGILESGEVLQLLRSLRRSPLYREDQNSYLLYPDRSTPAFLEKNRLDRKKAEAIPLLRAMLEKGDQRIIRPLPSGGVAFNGSFHNAKEVDRVLNELKDVPGEDRSAILELFETAFNHHAFTGRSGTFFAYEGLGSIYWHMVSKLALAVQENFLSLRESCAPEEAAQLLEAFREIREGLGVDKDPATYGAIPTDAYSHTPFHAGAQQPGMTGQVKEDILIRLNELGIRVVNGCLSLDPSMIEPAERLSRQERLRIPREENGLADIPLDTGSLGFCFCGTPVVYQSGGATDPLRVIHADGSVSVFSERQLPEDLSRQIFLRSGAIQRIEVALGA